jgi:hypothetical protein
MRIYKYSQYIAVVASVYIGERRHTIGSIYDCTTFRSEMDHLGLPSILTRAFSSHLSQINADISTEKGGHPAYKAVRATPIMTLSG